MGFVNEDDFRSTNGFYLSLILDIVSAQRSTGSRVTQDTWPSVFPQLLASVWHLLYLLSRVSPLPHPLRAQCRL